jgi:putative transposase
VVTTKLRLSERTFRCGQCPLVLDRDLNAARNLAALVGEVIGAKKHRGGALPQERILAIE